MDVEAACEKIDKTVDRIDKKLERLARSDPYGVSERLECIREKLKSIRGTMENRGSLTSKQRAVINSYCLTVDQIFETLPAPKKKPRPE